MKPLEECLDIILRKLRENWDLEPLPPLDVEALLLEFEIKQRRHEFFKGLISILIKDENAYLIDPFKPNLPNEGELAHIRKKTMLTAHGFYFIEAGGYVQAKINGDAKNIQLDKIERAQKGYRCTQNVLLILVALGTLIAALYYCVELYWGHGWFHF